jgi:5S rRNA maturation endonuclease (ribonuclease M5)
VKVRVPIPRLLDQLGIRARRDGRLWKAVCPNPDHDDKHPSWSIVDDGSPRHGSHWCMACGFGGGPWELAAAVRRLELPEAGDWVWEHVVGGQNRAVEDRDLPVLRVAAPAMARPIEMTMPRHVRIPSVDGSEWFPRALAYLDSRGVPEWQRARWHFGYATLGRLAWRVVVPVYTRGLLLSYVARAFIDDGRIRYLTPDVKGEPGCRPSAALWGEPGFDLDVRVAVVTEGVFKAMAMERAGAPNPCAILGSQNLGTDKIELLQQFDALIIATDPDKAGRIAAEKIADAVVRYTEPVVADIRVAPDDATEEENGERWRDAMRRAHPTLRARRLARLGAS